MKIIESNSGKDLSPFIMVGEMERRIGEIWNNSSLSDKWQIVKPRVQYVCKFSDLPKEIKQLIINKLS